MFCTPLKNSKNVNKPFKSPFDTPSTPNNNNNETLTKSAGRKTMEKKISIPESPLSSRASDAKRTLKLDDEDTPKKQKFSIDDIEKIDRIVPKDATKNDLLALKRKIFELCQELERLKSRERCATKNDPKILRESIDKWRTACQSALEIVCTELREKNGQSTKISDVLNMLGIPETIVRYSEKDDEFV